MPTATCPSTDELRALSLGETHAEASESLLEHVASCTDCQAELETVDQHSDSLIASLRGEDLGESFEKEGAYQTALAKALAAYSIVSSEQPVMPELPKQIGEYEILRPLGHGGMGSVWLARHTKLGREVALKLLSRHRWTHPQLRERFEAEMRAIGRLSHPNIVIAHDARDVGGCAVLVTEYVDGFDLGKLLQRTGPMPVAEACEIVRQVAVALEYTHSQGFVHRDIKPSNVMLSRSGSIKLLDLGLARVQLDEGVAEMTATGQSLGTADYMAPEQVSDARSVDIRADIYSLGCTLMKLLTGRAPFAEQTTSFAKMTAHVSGQPPRLDNLRTDIPQSLSELVAQMLAKRPKDRPQSPADIRQALTAFCAGSDLGQLVQRAEASTPLSELPLPALATAVAMSGASARSGSRSGWLHRRVPTYIAIAAGFFGFLLGGLLSIIIIITNPDGTKSVLKLAEGSKVEIQAEESGVRDAKEVSQSNPETKYGGLLWVPYSEEKLVDYRRNGKTVMLYFNADWSIVGQENLKSAIGQPKVVQFIQDNPIIPMLVDFTQPSLAVETKMREFGRETSIPLLAIYPPFTESSPVILRDQFTAGDVWQALEQCTNVVDESQSIINTIGRSKNPWQPLALGVLLFREEAGLGGQTISEAELQDARRVLERSGTRSIEKPVVTPYGIWYPVSDAIELPHLAITEKRPVNQYVLLSLESFLDMNLLAPGIQSLDSSSTNDAIEVSFTAELSNRIDKLVQSSPENWLAVINGWSVQSLESFKTLNKRKLSIKVVEPAKRLEPLVENIREAISRHQKSLFENANNSNTEQDIVESRSLSQSNESTEESELTTNISTIQRLAFGVIETPGPKESATHQRWLTAAESIDASLTRMPVRTQFGTWFPAGNEPEEWGWGWMLEDAWSYMESIGIKDRYVLVQNEGFIDWKDVRGHIETVNVNGQGIQAFLDDALSQNLERLTSDHVGKHLAIIVNDQVRMLARINSPITGNSIQISGTFEEAEIKNLMQWLHGGLVDPLPSDSDSAAIDASSPMGRKDEANKSLGSDGEHFVTLEAARQNITDALQVGFPDAAPEGIQSLVETFFDPKHVESSELGPDQFSFRLRMSDAIEAMVLRGVELQAHVQENGAVTQADEPSPSGDPTSSPTQVQYKNATEIVRLVRALAGGLNIFLQVIPPTAFDEANTAEPIKAMPILFIFTVTDEELLQTMLTDVAGMSGWTPWQEKGIQAFPIYSRSGDPKAADAIVGFIRGSAIVVGSYERLQQWLAPPWTKY